MRSASQRNGACYKLSYFMEKLIFFLSIFCSLSLPLYTAVGIMGNCKKNNIYTKVWLALI